MKPIPLWIALAAVLVCASSLGAQRLIVRTYTVSDGLPSDRVLCVVTDDDGFVWICTANGIARFDGAAFTTYGLESGVPDAVVNHFLHARSGSRWVATNGGGVARLEPGDPGADLRVFRTFPVGSSPRSMRINVLFETPDGTLLAGTDGGLFRGREAVAEPRFELVPLELPGQPDSGLQIWSIAQDRAGRTWVGTSAGLVLLGRWKPLAHVRVAPAQGADHVSAIASDDVGRLWIGYHAGLIVWMPPGGPIALEGRPDPLVDDARSCSAPGAPTGLASLPRAPGSACRWGPGPARGPGTGIHRMLRTGDGWLWMTSQAGLVGFDGSRFHLFDEARGISRQVAMDPGGDLWVSSTRGIDRVQRRGFTHFSAEDGLTGGSLRRLFRGWDGHLYAVTAGSTLLRFDGERWTAVRPRLPDLAGVAGRSTYGAALLDRGGSWWIGTGAGLLRFPAVVSIEELARTEPIARYTTVDGLAGDDIWHLFEDTRGDIWIATRVPKQEPLTRWERSSGRFHRYGPGQGLPGERAVWGFAEDGAGALWVSFWDGGLARFDGSDFRYFAPGDDFPDGHSYQILVDHRGWLWVGGRQVVYSRNPEAADPRFQVFRTAEDRSVRASFLGEDAHGWIYAGTPTGLVRFLADVGRLQRLGTGGMFADIASPFHRDEDGTLWTADQSNVLRYEPRYARRADPPPVWIGGLSVAGVPVPIPAMGARAVGPLRLASGRQLRIEYFGLGFGVDEPLLFQVRLDGVDPGWGSPTSERTVLYAGLGPGRYRFQVRAVDADGRVTREPASVAVVVLPPLWRRGWFIAVLLAALGSLLVAAHRLRVQRLLELERVRTRIAADLHDDLGASLARVSLLAEAVRRTVRGRPEAAERMVGEIGETSRRLVSAAGDIAYSIDPGRGSLESLAARVRRFAEELLAGTDVEWSFRSRGATAAIVLSSDQRRHLLAILKEALHNAVRHGCPEHLALTLAAGDGVLEAEIADDGRGFNPEAADDGAIPESGHGLRNLRRRARELGGVLEIDSRPGRGTRVALSVPLRSRPRMSM